MGNMHLEINNLVFGYKKAEPILDHLNMAVPKGSIYGFLGMNGVGKTTTIRNILGLLEPNSGEILIKGERVSRHSQSLFSKVGSLIENPSLYEHLSAYDNLKLACNYFSISKDRIHPILAKVGLQKVASVKSKKYSTGMKQRLGLAMALIHDPELLILDEPIRGLDPSGIKEIRKLIHEINEQGTTILLSSHILTEIEKLVSHVGILKDGKLQFQGTLESLMNQINESSRIKVRMSNPSLFYESLQDREDVFFKDKWVSLPYMPDKEVADFVKKLNASGHDLYEIQKDKSALESVFIGNTNNLTK